MSSDSAVCVCVQKMTFPGTDVLVAQKVVKILTESRDIYEGYTAPLGIGFIVFGGGDYKPGHGACAPPTPGPGGT